MSSDLQSELTTRKLLCVAAVNDTPRATDYAVALSNTRLVIIRRVDRATWEDHAVLATMVSEGDFVWAGLVYSDQLGTDWPGHIEAFHISELPRLIERLHALQREAAT